MSELRERLLQDQVRRYLAEIQAVEQEPSALMVARNLEECIDLLVVRMNRITALRRKLETCLARLSEGSDTLPAA
jgi:prefoldin subunit 5